MAFDFGSTRERLDRIDSATTWDTRSAMLEELTSEMLTSMPGVDVPLRNVMPMSGVEELDMLATIRQQDDGLDGFEYDLLVECKSSAEKVGAHEVGWFAQKLRRRQLRMGLLISVGGVTGNTSTRRAAHREVERSADEGHEVLVLTTAEMMALRSPQHLVAVMLRKRHEMRGPRRAWVGTPEEIEALDPSPPRGVQLLRGRDALERAIRQMERDRIDELLDAGAALPDLPRTDAVERARRAFADLESEAQAHAFDSDYDPMWLNARGMVVATGGRVAAVLEPTPRSVDERRLVRFDVRTRGPRNLRLDLSSRPWRVITDLFLDEAAAPHPPRHERGVYGLLSILVEELIAIDDIEPPDAYAGL